MKKSIVFALCISLICITLCSCSVSDSDAGTGSSSGSGSVTPDGNTYTSVVNDDGQTGTVEYLGSTLDVDGGEYIDDDDFDEHWFCLHVTYTNDLGSTTADNDDEYEVDSCERSFFIQAVQNGTSILPRSEEETETFEEDNVFEVIDAGETRECEFYFPVDTSAPVTIQILDPSDEETVLAEYNYSPDNN